MSFVEWFIILGCVLVIAFAIGSVLHTVRERTTQLRQFQNDALGHIIQIDLNEYLLLCLIGDAAAASGEQDVGLNALQMELHRVHGGKSPLRVRDLSFMRLKQIGLCTYIHDRVTLTTYGRKMRWFLEKTCRQHAYALVREAKHQLSTSMLPFIES